MLEFDKGIRVTISMREDTAVTDYTSMYGGMIPGKSYLLIDVKYEIQKGIDFTFGEVAHGNYASFIGGNNPELDTDYTLMDLKTYKDVTNSDGLRVISFTSKSILSRPLDNYGRLNYITYTTSIGYGNLNTYSIPFNEFEPAMVAYVKPNIEVGRVVREGNKIKIYTRLEKYIFEGTETGTGIELYVKKNIYSNYSMVPYTIETVGGSEEYYLVFVIQNIEDDSYTGYFKINDIDNEITFPFFKIPSRYQLICFGKDGNAIAFGKICEQEGFENNLDSWFYKPVYFTDTVNFKKAPSGIPSDTIIITSTLSESEMIEMNFGDTMGNDPQTVQDDAFYSYKQTFWLLPSKYGKTINDFLNNCVIEMFLEEPCPSICPRLYYRNYSNDIEVQVLSMVKNIKPTKVRLRFTFSDVFTY